MYAVMTTIRQAFILASKDTKIFFKDRFATGFAFLFPFLFVVGFALALGGLGPSDDRLKFVVATRERDGISNRLLAELVKSDQVTIVALQYDDALNALDNGKIGGFVLFPSDFTLRLISGEPTTLEVEVTDEDSGYLAALTGFAQALARPFNDFHTVMLVASEVANANFTLIASTALESGLMEQSNSAIIEIDVEQVGDVEPWNASNFTLPGYLTMFVFFSASLSATAIAVERRNHTLERLLSNGVRRESIVFGKFACAAFLGLLQVIVMWVVGILAFDVDLGVSPTAVILISMLMVIASSSFGVLIASFAKNVRTAGSAGVLASIVLAPIGGCWWPLFIVPNWMQILAKITPHGWANTAFNKLMLFGADFGDVNVEMLALLAFAVLFAVVALWRFRTSSE